MTRWQRVWKTQPVGGFAGLGISPSSRIRVAVLAVDVRDGGQQRLRVRMVRSAEDRLRIADLHDPPEVHHGDPVGEVAHDAQVVRDDQVARLALELQLGEHVEDGGLDRDVERARRLVGDHDARVAREGPRDRHALLEPARELARLEVEVALREAQVGGELVDAFVDGLALEPGQLARRSGRGCAGRSSRGSARNRGSGRPSGSTACRRSGDRPTWPRAHGRRARPSHPRRGSRCPGSSWPASTCPTRTPRRGRASRRPAVPGRP